MVSERNQFDMNDNTALQNKADRVGAMGEKY